MHFDGHHARAVDVDVIWDVGQGELLLCSLLSPTTRVIVEVKRLKWVPVCVEVNDDVIYEKKIRLLIIGLKRQTLLPISTHELRPEENARSATLTK